MRTSYKQTFSGCLHQQVVWSSEPLTASLPSGDKHVLLVVMYHTLHEDHSSDLRRWSDRYENVVCEVDVLFHETVPGLLKCPQNNGAIKQIEETLRKHSKRR